MPGLQCRHAWLGQGLRGKNDVARAEGWWVGSESHPLKESGKGRTNSERESIHHTYTSRASSFLDAFWRISDAAFSPPSSSETDRGMCFHSHICTCARRKAHKGSMATTTYVILWAMKLLLLVPENIY